MIQKLIDLGNTYAKESTWKDYALVKFCLCAMGVIIGVNISPKHKDTAEGFALGIFLATYIPLMAKVFQLVDRMSTTEE